MQSFTKVDFIFPSKCTSTIICAHREWSLHVGGSWTFLSEWYCQGNNCIHPHSNQHIQINPIVSARKCIYSGPWLYSQWGWKNIFGCFNNIFGCWLFGNQTWVVSLLSHFCVVACRNSLLLQGLDSPALTHSLESLD